MQTEKLLTVNVNDQDTSEDMFFKKQGEKSMLVESFCQRSFIKSIRQ